LQQAPQLLQAPLRFFATGKNAVKNLFIFASQLFFIPLEAGRGHPALLINVGYYLNHFKIY